MLHSTSRNENWFSSEGPMNPKCNDFQVLVIDDSPVSRKLVALPLAQKQYKMIFAKSVGPLKREVAKILGREAAAQMAGVASPY